MQIRPATIEDVPLLAKLGKQFHKDAGFAEIQTYDEIGFQDSLMNILNNPLAVLITVWTDDEKFVGALSGGIFPNFYCPSEAIALAGFVCVLPEFRKTRASKDMTRVFEAWGKEMGATIITYMSNTVSWNKTLRRRGYRKTDVVMSKRIAGE